MVEAGVNGRPLTTFITPPEYTETTGEAAQGFRRSTGEHAGDERFFCYMRRLLKQLNSITII
jgi:hypothetical protein